MNGDGRILEGKAAHRKEVRLRENEAGGAVRVAAAVLPSCRRRDEILPGAVAQVRQ